MMYCTGGIRCELYSALMKDEGFENVYQIWDNHVDGKNVDKDYLYDERPDIPIHDDIYYFPNLVFVAL